MPNIKSAKKRAALSAEQRESNRARRSALRTAIKKVTTSLAAASPAVLDEARANLFAAAKKLDQAAAAGLIHKNTAARRKSRLMRKLNAAGKKA